MTITNTIKSVAAAALVSVAALAPAQAFVDPIEVDLAPMIVSYDATAQQSASADLDAFIDGLKAKRDDGSLNERDFRAIREFQTADAGLDAFIDGLKAKRDDGSLNERDFRAIRNFTA